jgi:hypothetical protein
MTPVSARVTPRYLSLAIIAMNRGSARRLS